jgi:LDH2 family malate/lactate/ureidoglycolate dehydrogenase
VDSHGNRACCRRTSGGNPARLIVPPRSEVARDDGTTAVVDGQQAFGHYTSTVAMELAIAKRGHIGWLRDCRN